MTGPHFGSLLSHSPMSKVAAMQSRPPTDQQRREAICFCLAKRTPVCTGSNWIFVGREAKRASSCCRQTRGRLPLLHTSILRARHGPELPAVLWLETPCLTKNTKRALPPRGELKTFFCCYLSKSAIGRGGWGQKLD